MFFSLRDPCPNIILPSEFSKSPRFPGPIASRHLFHLSSSSLGFQDGGMKRGTEAIKSYLRNICFVAVRNTRFVMEIFEGLRRRKVGVNEGKDIKKEEKTRDEKNLKDAAAGTVEPGTYWLTRIVFLRSLGFIYCKLLE